MEDLRSTTFAGTTYQKTAEHWKMHELTLLSDGALSYDC